MPPTLPEHFQRAPNGMMLFRRLKTVLVQYVCSILISFNAQLVANKVSSSLKYSPQSACLKQVMPVGSSRLASCVLLAVTPKPNGVSFMLYTTTPWCSGQSSDHLPTCAFTTCEPYKNGISPFARFILVYNFNQCIASRGLDMLLCRNI
jgi:hypothetical protein